MFTIISGIPSRKVLKRLFALVLVLTPPIDAVPIKAIDSAYSVSKKLYAKKQFSKAHEELRKAMGTAGDFSDIVTEGERSTFIPILNDYAFFLYKDFEFQSKKWCASPEKASVVDFQTFRSQTLDEAQEALEYVLGQDSTRVVAQLNLADVYLNQDEPEKAELMYGKYVRQMEINKKSSKIVPRARPKAFRKRAFDCR